MMKWNKYAMKVEWIQSILLANECGGSETVNQHSHGYVKTTEKMDFLKFQEKWEKHFGFRVDELESVKNVDCWIRYCTKEDCQPFKVNIDADKCHLQCRAFMCAQKHGFSKLSAAYYPYRALTGAQKRDFEQMYNLYVQEDMRSHSKYIGATLHGWQEEIMELLLAQTNRQVLWIFDQEGGKGKTFLTQYLRDNHGAITLSNGPSKDIAHCYNEERIVCFNYARSDIEHLNYRIIEDLKDGAVFSPKYDSCVKTFDPPKVICMPSIET